MSADGQIKIVTKIDDSEYSKSLGKMKQDVKNFANSSSKDFSKVTQESIDLSSSIGTDTSDAIKNASKQVDNFNYSSRGLLSSLSQMSLSWARGNRASIQSTQSITHNTQALIKQAAARKKLNQEIVATNRNMVIESTRQLEELDRTIARRKGMLEELRAVKPRPFEAPELNKTIADREKNLANLQAKRVKTVTALNVAQGKLNATMGKGAVSGNILTRSFNGLRRSGAGLLRALGGPISLAITALTVGVMAFASRQKDASATTDKFSSEIELLKGSAEGTSRVFQDLARSISQMSREQAGFELIGAKESLQEVKEEMVEFQDKARGFKGTLKTIFIEGDIAGQSPFAGAIADLDRGVLSAEKFRNKVYAIGKELDEAGKKDTQKLVDLSFKYDFYSKAVENYNKNLKRSFNDAGESFDDLAKALSNLDKTPSNFEEALNFMESLIGKSEESKKSTEQAMRADANHAIQILKKAEALSIATEAQLVDDWITARSQGKIKRSIELEKELTEAINIRKQVQTSIAKGSSVDWKKVLNPRNAKSAGKSVTDVIKEITREIDQLNQTGANKFTSELERGLDDIASKGNAAHMALAQIEGLQAKFQEAFVAKNLQDFNDELDRMSGKADEVDMRKLEESLENWRDVLVKAGFDVDEINHKLDTFKDKATKQLKTKNLQELLGFYKELEGLTGTYGLSLKTQNELLEMQAAHFKTIVPEAKHELVDLWLQLKKMENSDDWGDGWKRASQKYVEEWTKASSIAEKQFTALADTMEDIGGNLVDAIFDDADFRVDKLFKELLKNLMKITMNRMFANILGGIFGGSVNIAPVGHASHVGPQLPSRAAPASAPMSMGPSPFSASLASAFSSPIAQAVRLTSSNHSSPAVRGFSSQSSLSSRRNAGSTEINIIDQRSNKSEPVQTQKTDLGNGDFRYDVLITETVAKDIVSGGSIANALDYRANRNSRYGRKV